MKQQAVLITVLLALQLGVILGQSQFRKPLLKLSYSTVCETVEQKYYEVSERFYEWVSVCRQRAATFDERKSLKEFIAEVNSLLNTLSVSHLSIWDPTDMRGFWAIESKETGLRVRRIKDHFVITKLVEGGPAQRAGLKLGDEIVSINGRPLQTKWQPQSQSGKFTIYREPEVFDVFVTAETLYLDSSPVLEIVDVEKKKMGVLTIPSFVSTYFDKEEWSQTAAQFQGLDKIVIDVRQNLGGHFVPTLRALSSFFCESKKIGQLVKPRINPQQLVVMQDNITSQYQTELVKTASAIELKTFEDYPCFTGEVVVLIDEGTASTAEIFAQAFYLRPKSQVWGDFSAGEVVQAVWHPLPLGSGFALSVPDAMYLTSDNVGLEGLGVRPIRLLEYDLDLAREGLDSWIQEAL